MSLPLNWKKPTTTLLLIGPSAVGKTEFLNLLANAFAGRKLDDASEGAHSISTQKCSLHTFSCNGRTLQVLDTPGLHDDAPGSEERAKEIAQSISEEVETVDAILLLMNGTEPKLRLVTDFALKVIASLFHDSITANIGTVYTMVSNPLQHTENGQTLPTWLHKVRSWTLDNPIPNQMKLQTARKSIPPSIPALLSDMDNCVQRTLKMAYASLGDLIKWINESPVQPLKAVYDLYQVSEKIEASMTNTIAFIEQTEDITKQLAALGQELTAQTEAQKVNQKYKAIITKPYYEHEVTTSHNTLCIMPNCYHNCHLGCYVPFTLDRGILGRSCQAFNPNTKAPDGGKLCVVTGCGHSSQLHQHYMAKWVMKMREETVEDRASRERYDKATSEIERLSNLRERLGRKLSELRRSIESSEHKLSDLCDEYNSLSFSKSFVSSVSHAIRILDMRRERMQTSGASPSALKTIQDRIAALEAKKVATKVVRSVQPPPHRTPTPVEPQPHHPLNAPRLLFSQTVGIASSPQAVKLTANAPPPTSRPPTPKPIPLPPHTNHNHRKGYPLPSVPRSRTPSPESATTLKPHKVPPSSSAQSAPHPSSHTRTTHATHSHSKPPPKAPTPRRAPDDIAALPRIAFPEPQIPSFPPLQAPPTSSSTNVPSITSTNMLPSTGFYLCWVPLYQSVPMQAMPGTHQ